MRTCVPHEDTCWTQVRWQMPPYYQFNGAKKEYQISKGCTSYDKCIHERSQRNRAKKCRIAFYNDWDCFDCCDGDLCNYYVHLAAQSTHHESNALLFMIAVNVLLSLRFY